VFIASLRHLLKNSEVKIPGDEAVNSMYDSSEHELNERWRNWNLKENPEHKNRRFVSFRDYIKKNLLHLRAVVLNRGAAAHLGAMKMS